MSVFDAGGHQRELVRLFVEPFDPDHSLSVLPSGLLNNADAAQSMKDPQAIMKH